MSSMKAKIIRKKTLLENLCSSVFVTISTSSASVASDSKSDIDVGEEEDWAIQYA